MRVSMTFSLCSTLTCSSLTVHLPVLSLIIPSDVSLPNATPVTLHINAISKFSNPSNSSSQVIEILALPSVAPALIVILNGLESKSTPDPMGSDYYKLLIQ